MDEPLVEQEQRCFHSHQSDFKFTPVITKLGLGSAALATPAPSSNSTPSKYIPMIYRRISIHSLQSTTPINKIRYREEQDEILPPVSSPPKKRPHTALQSILVEGPMAPLKYTPRQTKPAKLTSIYNALDATYWTLFTTHSGGRPKPETTYAERFNILSI